MSQTEMGRMMYEGKAKQVYEVIGDDEKVIIHYKDDATAGNGAKHGIVAEKGILNNQITTYLFTELQKQGIPTHYIKTLNERDQLCKKCTIIPLEVIVRDVIAGSLATKFNLTEGTEPKAAILEICYKNDALNDPMINDSQAIGLGFATKEELASIYALANRINQSLTQLFSEVGVRLIDFKLEFGKDRNGMLMLADEISPDTCRLWDATTNKKLDKDRFRRDLGDVIGAYQEIWKRLSQRESKAV